VGHDAPFALLLEFLLRLVAAAGSPVLLLRPAPRLFVLLALFTPFRSTTNLKILPVGAACCALQNWLALLAGDLPLAATAPRADPCGTGVGVRPLAAHGQIAPMANTAVGLKFNQPAECSSGSLCGESPSTRPSFFNFLAEMVHFVFRQVADLLRVIQRPPSRRASSRAPARCHRWT